MARARAHLGEAPVRFLDTPSLPEATRKCAVSMPHLSRFRPDALLSEHEAEPLLYRPRAASATPAFLTGSDSMSRVPALKPGTYIGVFRGTCMLMSMMLGAGLFISPGIVLHYCQSVWVSLGAYIFAGTLCMIGALCYAEIGTALPLSGGEYTYFYSVLGRPVAFSFVWTTFWLLKTASQSIFALTIAETLGSVFFGLPLMDSSADQLWTVKAGGMAVLIILCAINCCGVHWGAYVGVLVTILNMGTVGLILQMGATAIFYTSTKIHYEPPPGPAAPVPSLGVANLPPLFMECSPAHDNVPAEQINNFGLAVLVCLWAYDGWNGLNYATGSLENPQKTLPRCIMLGVSCMVLIFLAVVGSYLGALAPEVVASAPVVAIALGERVMGQYGRMLIALAISVSCIGACNGSILTGSQIYYRAASDGLWPVVFQRVTKKSEAPYVALIFQCVWTCLALCAGGMRILINYFSFCQFLFYAMAIVCLFKLRQDGVVGGYQTPAYPLFPCLFLIITAMVIVNSMMAAPLHSVIALSFIVISLPVSFLCGCARAEEEVPVLTVTPSMVQRLSQLSQTASSATTVATAQNLNLARPKDEEFVFAEGI